MSFKIYGAQWLGRLKRSLDDDVPPEQAEAPRTTRQYEDNAAFGQQDGCHFNLSKAAKSQTKLYYGRDLVLLLLHLIILEMP